MKRNQQTTAGELEIGDRFFKTSDKTKRVMEVIQNQKTASQVYSMFVLPYNAKFAEPMKSNTSVTFLRSAD